MDKVTVTMKHKKSTKGTEVYEEIVENSGLSALYLGKSLVGTPPTQITVTIESS